MKRVPVVLAAAFYLASGAAAQSVVDRAGDSEGLTAIRAVDNSIGFSWLVSRVYYVEPNNGYATTPNGYLDAETGNVNGPKLALTTLTRNNMYFHADGSWATGKLAYSGYLQGGPPYIPAVGRSNAIIWEGNLRAGKAFALGRSWMLTPFIGGGRRYWVRELGAGTPGSFVESYSFFYYAFGAMAQFAPSRRWVFTVDGTIGRTSDASIHVPPVLNHAALGTALLKKAGLEADYGLSGPFHLFAGLDYEAFTFGESGIQNGALEPYSKTKVYNCNFGVRYAFGRSSAKSKLDSDMSFD